MMDQMFEDIVGKPHLNKQSKIITIVADNFTFLEDNARFLKAVLAIPALKKLPLDNLSRRLIQFGPVPLEVEEQVRHEKWAINRLEMASQDPEEPNKLLKISHKHLMNHGGHFIVMLYQKGSSRKDTTFVRDAEYLSDGFVRVTLHPNFYFMSQFYQSPKDIKTLIPSKVVTSYYTCRIGKSYWSELLCFFDRKDRVKGYDPENDSAPDQGDSGTSSRTDEADPTQTAPSTTAQTTDSDDEIGFEATKPYTRAQDPEKAQIFYYVANPDDDDDQDPDQDLEI